MARFRATIQGQRGSASRLGSTKTGITANVNGWNSGVRVLGEVLAFGDRDRFEIYVTGGSHARSKDQYIGSVEIVNGSPVFSS